MLPRSGARRRPFRRIPNAKNNFCYRRRLARGVSCSSFRSGAASSSDRAHQKQVQSYIGAAGGQQISEKIKDKPTASSRPDLRPPPKKAGFASYAETTMSSNISKWSRHRPEDQEVGDPQAMIQAQIAELNADKR